MEEEAPEAGPVAQAAVGVGVAVFVVAGDWVADVPGVVEVRGFGRKTIYSLEGSDDYEIGAPLT